MKTLTAVALIVLLFLDYLVVNQAPSGQSISQQSGSIDILWEPDL